jgi:hypothetical protein
MRSVLVRLACGTRHKVVVFWYNGQNSCSFLKLASKVVVFLYNNTNSCSFMKFTLLLMGRSILNRSGRYIENLVYEDFGKDLFQHWSWLVNLISKYQNQTLLVMYAIPQLLNYVNFQVCNPSIQFMIYETLAKRLQSKRSGKQLPKKNLTAMGVHNLQT